MLETILAALQQLLPALAAAGLAFVFGTIYVAYGEAHSNRRAFAQNFVLVAMITSVIIMIVKQSIALSLGLVGALSIVRFRVAIKEPEELSFLFLMIAIGIGTGAGEIGLITGFSVVVGVILIARKLFSSKQKISRGSYNVNVVSKKAKQSGPQELLEILKNRCSRASLKRFDENGDTVDALFYAEFPDEEAFSSWRSDLMSFDSEARVSFLDAKGIF